MQKRDIRETRAIYEGKQKERWEMRVMQGNGLPNVALLLFTMLIWGLYSMILVSSPRNKVNQWCFIGGILLSVGVLKEYIY